MILAVKKSEFQLRSFPSESYVSQEVNHKVFLKKTLLGPKILKYLPVNPFSNCTIDYLFTLINPFDASFFQRLTPEIVLKKEANVLQELILLKLLRNAGASFKVQSYFVVQNEPRSLARLCVGTKKRIRKKYDLVNDLDNFIDLVSMRKRSFIVLFAVLPKGHSEVPTLHQSGKFACDSYQSCLAL